MSEETLAEIGSTYAQDPQPEPAPEPAPEPELAPESEPVEPAPEPEPDPVEKRLKGLETALSEERKKRQHAEQEMEWLRRSQQQMQQQQHQPWQPQQPDWDQENEVLWKNPAAYTRQTAEEIATRMLQAEKAQMEQQRVVMSEQRAMQTHPDYLEKCKTFASLAQQDPSLVPFVRGQADPAQALYDLVVKYENYSHDPAEMKKRIEAKVRAEFEAKTRGAKAKQAAQQSVPTQAGARGTGTPGAQEIPPGGMMLDDVFKSY